MTDSQKAFTQMAQPGLVSGNAYTIEFSASGYQLSSTTDGKYRIMADDQSQYVEAAVSRENRLFKQSPAEMVQTGKPEREGTYHDTEPQRQQDKHLLAVE